MEFGDVVFYEFLESIGLHAAKSKTLQYVNVPSEWFADFFRGLYDGDGSFYTEWDKRWPRSFVYILTISSASKTFIEWLKERLSGLYDVRGTLRRGDGVWTIRYRKGDTKKLFEVMYAKNDPALYLTRKFDRIREAMEFDAELHAGPG